MSFHLRLRQAIVIYYFKFLQIVFLVVNFDSVRFSLGHLSNMAVFCQQTNGISNGLTPMLRVYNNTARYVDQGGNKVY